MSRSGHAPYAARRAVTTKNNFPSLLSVINGAGFIGYDAVLGQAWWRDTSGIYLSPLGAAGTFTANKTVPTGVTTVFTCTRIVRAQLSGDSGPTYYAIFQDNPSGNYKVYSAPVVAAGSTLTWTARKTLAANAAGISGALGVSPDGTILLVSEYSPSGGTVTGGPNIYRSTDGTTFTKVDGPEVGSGAKHFHGVWFDPYDTGVCYAALGDGTSTPLLKSTDSGVTWAPVATVGTGWDFVQMSFHPDAIVCTGDASVAPFFVLKRGELIPKVVCLDHPKNHAVYNAGAYQCATIVKDGGITQGTAPNFESPITTDDIGRKVIAAGTASAAYTDGVTNTDTSLVSATANFTADDVGLTVTGTGIQAATTISSVTNPTTVVLNKATTATASGVTITIAARKMIRRGTTITAVAGSAVTISPVAAAAGTQQPFQVDRGERYYATALYGAVDPATGLVYLAFTDPGTDPNGLAYRYSLFVGSIYGGTLKLLGNLTASVVFLDVDAGTVFAGSNRLTAITDGAW